MALPHLAHESRDPGKMGDRPIPQLVAICSYTMHCCLSGGRVVWKVKEELM